MLHKLNKLQNVDVDQLTNDIFQSDFKKVKRVIGDVFEYVKNDWPHNVLFSQYIVDAASKLLFAKEQALYHVVLVLIFKDGNVERLTLVLIVIHSLKYLINRLGVVTKLM